MSSAYPAHAPFVLLFLLFTVILLAAHWRTRRSP